MITRNGNGVLTRYAIGPGGMIEWRGQLWATGEVLDDLCRTEAKNRIVARWHAPTDWEVNRAEKDHADRRLFPVSPYSLMQEPPNV